MTSSDTLLPAAPCSEEPVRILSVALDQLAIGLGPGPDHPIPQVETGSAVHADTESANP